jgi:hypothetical protein
MWLCFNDAFVSAVAGDDNLLKVRARRKDHLINLFPDLEDKIVQTKNTDYKYRVFITRERLAEVVSKRIMDIDYGNFKASVKDWGLHNLYADFWELHYLYQK